MDSTGFISRDNLKAVLGKTYDNSLIDKMLEVYYVLDGRVLKRERVLRQKSRTYEQSGLVGWCKRYIR